MDTFAHINTAAMDDKATYRGLPTDFPAYVLEEELLRRNLSLIKGVAEAAGVEIILAFKAFALWKTFPIFREYISCTTASSLYEARLAYEKFGCRPHTYSPAYTAGEIRSIAAISSHITFNSMGQAERFCGTALDESTHCSIGLRINPGYSEVETGLYNPCQPGTRFGVRASALPDKLPFGVEGFHCHTLCESGADTFRRTLAHIEDGFSKWFGQLKWINFGGGHLMTRNGYDTGLLVDTLKEFKSKYPWLHVILEPGSAFAWQTGGLVAQVADIVEDCGIRTAILNVSFTCHMPDCLEMPYQPAVRGAKALPDSEAAAGSADRHIYRLGGNSCLSGDFIGAWEFGEELEIGQSIVLEDMMHYTTVKTNMFNGVAHPAIALLHTGGELEILRSYGYEDYLCRMD